MLCLWYNCDYLEWNFKWCLNIKYWIRITLNWKCSGFGSMWSNCVYIFLLLFILTIILVSINMLCLVATCGIDLNRVYCEILHPRSLLHTCLSVPFSKIEFWSFQWIPNKYGLLWNLNPCFCCMSCMSIRPFLLVR